MDPQYDPTADYSAAYGALGRRIQSNFAGQRANLNQELATRGVNTSGVSAIPSARLGAAEAGERDAVAARFAELQAGTKVQDRQRLDEFNNQKTLFQMGADRQDAMARRQAQGGLESALISGGSGAVGTVFGGPMGGMLAAKMGPKLLGSAGIMVPKNQGQNVAGIV